jgi:hypothetical protein
VSHARFRVPPTCIADFAVGDGELLRAAQAKWPRAKLIGTDINARTVYELRRLVKTWKVDRCDFLNPKSRQHARVFENLKSKVSLVLLNPPFSCRGARKFKAQFCGTEISCSLALAFVITSLNYLSDRGQLLAILPIGCLHSEKDKAAWAAIRSMFRVEHLAQNGHKTFSGWSPKTAIVKISRGRHTPASHVLRATGKLKRRVDGISFQLFRGKIPMHTLNGNTKGTAIPLIHSTELGKPSVDLTRRSFDVTKTNSICGPAVLIQRVGLPDPKKIQLYLKPTPIALSDCIIAIRCKSTGEAETVKDRLLFNWQTLEGRYGGTCARYITLTSLRDFLLTLGFREISF